MRAPTPGRGRGRARQSTRGGRLASNRRADDLIDQEEATMNDNYRRRAGALPTSVGELISPENGIPTPRSPTNPAPDHPVVPEVVPITSEGSNTETVRRRGINRGTDIPNQLVQKPRAVVHKGCFIGPKVIRDITCILKDHFTGPSMSWMEIPEGLRDDYFDMFQERYKVPTADKGLYGCVFHATAMRRYNRMLCEARNSMMQKLRTGKIKSVSAGCPDWMNNQIWDQLLLKWDTPTWLAKSEAGRKNRLTEKDGSMSKHTGVQFPLLHTKELEREPTQMEQFERVHRRKVEGHDFVDNKSKRVSAEYLAALLEKYGSQETASNVRFDEEVWIEASGGTSKGRLYGVVGLVERTTRSANMARSAHGSIFIEEQLAKINEVAKAFEEPLVAVVSVRVRTEFEAHLKEQFEKWMDDYKRRHMGPDNNGMGDY